MLIDKLVIDRSKWGMNRLIREDGRMCCLGHAASACGVSLEKLRTRVMPDSSWDINPGLSEGFGGDRDVLPVGLPAQSINDSNMTWPDKETRLIKLFAINGIELSFTGEGYQDT